METTSLDKGIERKARFVGQREKAAAGEGRTSPASFHSILFDSSDSGIVGEKIELPDFFRDLNLDQMVDAIFGNTTKIRSEISAIQEANYDNT